MRASFLLVLTLAVLVGLAVAVGFRYSGFLNPAPVATVPVVAGPVVEKIVPPAPLPKVVATTRNLFAGDTIDSLDVYLRNAKPEELKDLESHKDAYLPSLVSSAYFRTPMRNLEADTPIKKADLEEMAKPEALHTRLTPGTRALGVSIPKPQSAGGLIQVGDWVDVYVTTEVSRTDLDVKVPHTGLVVKAAQVVAKRDTLYKIYSGLPSEFIHFTLSANPYRTALIEYARTIGTLSMVPVSAEEKKKYDVLKDASANNPDKAIELAVGNTDGREGREELRRVKEYEAGTLGVGATDIFRILNLKPIPVPDPPPPPMIPPHPPRPEPPTSIEIYNGTSKKAPAVFGPPVVPEVPAPVIIVQPPAVPPKQGEYLFTKPVPLPPEPKPATGGK
ncbi:Flp pilus assembly protein CpaB [Limnoglobus roseus]|uniref:Flp pilus assembly protein CpaB n=1 Tax=Limnoglobus roseus TaxID=2598579 RepID=A0A5C1A4E9_9BACT|nr:Flp pilus assembly protein CpaB [Limnoglobus roseus]QEL13257.1 Flp pilus assembly protein CpaB [Limnoglobus roseus]